MFEPAFEWIVWICHSPVFWLPCFWWKVGCYTLLGLFVNYQINFLLLFSRFSLSFYHSASGCTAWISLCLSFLEYIELLGCVDWGFSSDLGSFSAPHFHKYLSCSFLFPGPALLICMRALHVKDSQFILLFHTLRLWFLSTLSLLFLLFSNNCWAFSRIFICYCTFNSRFPFYNNFWLLIVTVCLMRHCHHTFFSSLNMVSFSYSNTCIMAPLKSLLNLVPSLGFCCLLL